MSIIFTTQPTGIMGANSPIIYQAYDTAYANAGFYYRFQIFVWSGTTTIPATPIVTIERRPDQYGGGRAWIDIHKIVKQYVTTEYLVNGTYKPNIGNGVMNMAVKVGGIWDTGSTTAISSNVFLSTAGWEYTMDGFNANFASKYVYTDKSFMELTTETDSYYLFYDATRVTSISVGAYSISPNAVGASGTKIQGVDIVQLLTAAGQTGNNVNVSFNYSGGAVVIPVRYQCQNKFGEVDVHFLNRYGTYETMVFNAVSRRTQNITRESYQRAMYRQTDLGANWTYGVPITTNFMTNATTQLVVNTNWVDESYNEIIQQLMVSENVLVIDGSDVVSARITDSAFAEKKRVNEKLIQYTLTLEFNQPLINKIVR
jgi:hypothetical protein